MDFSSLTRALSRGASGLIRQANNAAAPAYARAQALAELQAAQEGSGDVINTATADAANRAGTAGDTEEFRAGLRDEQAAESVGGQTAFERPIAGLQSQIASQPGAWMPGLQQHLNNLYARQGTAGNATLRYNDTEVKRGVLGDLEKEYADPQTAVADRIRTQDEASGAYADTNEYRRGAQSQILAGGRGVQTALQPKIDELRAHLNMPNITNDVTPGDANRNAAVAAKGRADRPGTPSAAMGQASADKESDTEAPSDGSEETATSGNQDAVARLAAAKAKKAPLKR